MLLADPGPLSLDEQRRTDIWNVFGSLGTSYYSAKLHHVLLAYFFRRLEYGRRTDKRNSGYLRLIGNSRLADEVTELSVPYSTQTLVDEQRRRPVLHGVKWLNPLLPNDRAREDHDRRLMTDLFGPPPSYSPYLNLTPGDGVNQEMRRWLDINALLLEDSAAGE